jgi:16S rRNA (guanine527-N7)-methyltransferase
VDRAAAGLGATIEPRAAEAIRTWLERLEEWNARMDLTAARSPAELVDLMVADALVLASRIPRAARVIDVGSGAGAPGLALALLRDDLEVTLVEPLAKRSSFLRTAIGSVRRSDIRLLRARGESLAGRRTWDVALSRATLPPQPWLELGAELSAPGGAVWVLLAREAPPSHARATMEVDLPYTWPLTSAQRRAVRYRLR